MTGEILSILGELIACDTQNPPREIGTDHPVFQVIGHHLAGCLDLHWTDHGDGCVSLLACRGRPHVLFNVHLDTVPFGDGWSGDPREMRISEDRVIGRGACDIKGAAACLMAAAKSVDSTLGILFTTDEEGSGNCCVRNFCQSAASRNIRMAIVAEPTGCRAVTAHRGYLSVSGRFSGPAGHSSRFLQLPDSANHRAIAWAGSALDQVRRFEARHLAGQSVCFNIGRLDGGTKNNMIAAECLLTWSMRPPPGVTNDQLRDLLTVPSPAGANWETAFAGPALPAGQPVPADTDPVAAFCRNHKIPMGPAVDFWTEASIFSECGFPAFVLGPGDIAQAHAPDEWVAIAQLEKAGRIYRKIMTETDASESSSH